MISSRPLNKPVMFKSAFIEPTKTQTPSVSVEQFKKIVDIFPDYEQYLKDKLVQYANLFELNQVSPQPVYVEQLNEIISETKRFISGTGSYREGFSSQTELSTVKEFFDTPQKKPIYFENISPDTIRKASTFEESGTALTYTGDKMGFYREGFNTQTTLTKPPGSRQLENKTGKSQEVFYLGDDNLGTITGTPSGRLNRDKKAERAATELLLVSNPLTNLANAFDATMYFNTSVLPSAATSGISTPQVIPEPQREKHESGSYYP
jgi:hypothetical protein